MLAIVYLAAATTIGDQICSRLFRFISLQHRLAAGFLVGLLLSTWITFVAAVVVHGAGQPLIVATLICAVVLAVVILVSRRWPIKSVADYAVRPPGRDLWDYIWLGVCLVFACWLMFATLGVKGGEFQIAFKAWTDFGANVSLTQSFALGKNFPPQHPFFPGEFIRYHFPFWFQSGNLEFLGLNPVWSINLLSVLSLIALIVLIATFGEVLFKSRIVGRIGAALFFFSSSLSYLPFLRSQSSIRGALNAIAGATEFLPSGYPFRGETWGVLSANVFAYQRHLISGIGLFFVALIFAVDEYQRRAAIKHEKQTERVLPLDNGRVDDEPATEVIPPEPPAEAGATQDLQSFARIPSWIFAGVLIGLLPYWNSPTFVAGLAVFGCLLLVAPLRSRTAVLIATAIVVGLPQVLMLRSGTTITY